MRYGSVCSGIEAASVAWEPLGWEPAWFAEIDKFPSAVLEHRYPHVRNFGDFTKITAEQSGTIDLLVGGTPCQAFSVAGNRAGLDDPRGNLTIEYLRLVARLRPRWFVWENVPGVLSIDGGRTFGTFLWQMAQLGYGFAYRVCDAQFFGVPQRRRRVFVVGYLGDWRRAAAVLFEQAGVRGDITSRKEKRQEVTYTTAPSLTANSGRNQIEATYIPCVARCDTYSNQRLDAETETLIVFDSVQITSKTNRSNPKPGDPCHTLHQYGSPIVVNARQTSITAYDMCPPLDQLSSSAVSWLPQGYRIQDISGRPSEVISCNPAGGCRVSPILHNMRVRRLTPRECERLQGFPDDWTEIPYNRTLAKDAPRYKAIGNSMAVPVMRWIGERIAFVDSIAVA